jgi:hypothetical protein
MSKLGAAAPVTEKAFLRQVTDLAHILGWSPYHTTFSKWSEAGWPDLALVRSGRLILAELKSEKGRLTPAQQVWLDRLRECPVEVYLWRPSDLEQIAQILR